MTGIMAAMAGTVGNGAMTMTVGSTSYVFDDGYTSTTLYSDGFIGAGSSISSSFPSVGALTPPLALGATVLALSWVSSTDHATGGQCQIEFDGTRDAAFLSDVKVAGVSLGTVSAPTHVGTTSTVYNLGSSSVANPFGTSGSKAISVI